MAKQRQSDTENPTSRQRGLPAGDRNPLATDPENQQSWLEETEAFETEIYTESESSQPEPPLENVSDFPERGALLDPDLSASYSEDSPNKEVYEIDQVGSNAATWMENTSFDSGVNTRKGSYKTNLGGRRVGGPTGGDFIGGGGHSPTSPEAEADTLKIGSREETQALLENRVADENARRARTERLK